jgi:hypothetical protein
MTTSMLHVADNTGHSTIEWDPTVAAEVDNARESFNRMKGDHKYLAYRVDENGDRTVIQEFDPDAGKIMMMPQTQGG